MTTYIHTYTAYTYMSSKQSDLSGITFRLWFAGSLEEAVGCSEELSAFRAPSSSDPFSST